LTKVKIKIDTATFGHLFNLIFPVFFILLSLISYFASSFLLNYLHKSKEYYSFFKAEWFSSIERLISELSSKKESIISRINFIEDNLKKEQAIKPLVFSPLNCYEKPRVEETASQSPQVKREKVRLSFLFDVEVKLIAIFEKRKLVTINGSDIRERGSIILPCGTRKCYIRVLKIGEDRVKVYIAPVDYKSKGRVREGTSG